MIRLALALLLILAACTPQSGTLVSRDTGLSGSYSQQVLISDHHRHRLMGHLIDVRREGTRVRALVIGRRFDGVNRLRMHSAWVNGVELPFSATSRLLDGCTHGHCREDAVGMIFLSDALFARATRNGLRARLIGRGQAVDIAVPAALFQSLSHP